MRRLAATLVTVALLGTGCAGETAATTAPAASGSPPPTTGPATPRSTTTTTPPAPIVAPEPGPWPAGLEQLVLAGPGGVTLLSADGTRQTLSDVPARVAELDGAGGLVLVPPVAPYQGFDADRVEWVAGWGPGQLMAVTPAGEMPFVDVVWVGSRYHGPRFAIVLVDDQRAEGDVRCLRLEPFAHVPGYVGVGSDVVCRPVADGRLTWASWSGRFFLLTLSAPEGGAWFEFVDADGRPLAMAHNPARPASAGRGLRLGTAVGGTNRMLFVEPDPAGIETLVGVDLTDGVEFLRTTVGTAGVTADRIEARGTAAVVSRTGPEQPAALLIDLTTGTVGTLGESGAATIPGDGPLEPVLYPAGTTAGGTPVIPDFVVTSPPDHARVDGRLVRFEGSVTPGSTVTAGGYPAAVDEEGRWVIDLVLEPGSNVATFDVTGPGPRPDAGYPVAVFREVEAEPDRWERFYFWVPAPDYGRPFGEPIVDVWTRPGSPTGDRAYDQGGNVIAVVDVYGSPFDPVMLWLVDQVGVGPAGHGRVYVTRDVLLVPDGAGVTYRTDERDRLIAEFAGRAFRADPASGSFVEVGATPAG